MELGLPGSAAVFCCAGAGWKAPLEPKLIPRANWPGDPGAGGGYSMLEFRAWYGPFQFVTLGPGAAFMRPGLDAAVQVVRRALGSLGGGFGGGSGVLGGAGVAVPPHQPNLHACGAAHPMPSMRDNPWRRCKVTVKVFKDAIYLCRADHHAGQPGDLRRAGACAGSGACCTIHLSPA